MFFKDLVIYRKSRLQYSVHLWEGLSEVLMWILALGGIRVLWLQWTESCEGKRMAQPFSQGESTVALALAFIFFSGHITLRMVLIYYAQVRFRWLQKTKERVLLIT